VVGILMAHRSVWLSVVEKQLEYAIVCEDDVRFVPAFASVFPCAFGELPVSWDIVYLGCQTCQALSLVDKIFCLSKGIPMYTVCASDHLTVPPLMFGAEAYMISLRGAKRLIKLTDRQGVYHVDRMVSQNRHDFDYYAISPQIAYQDGEVSTSNASQIPYLFNTMLSTVRLNRRNTLDTRTLGWWLSLNSHQVCGVPISKWGVVFFLFGLFIPPVLWIPYLLVENLLFRNGWLTYVGLWIPAVVGLLVRRTMQWRRTIS
jgi:GR25 family glycosyltransferase involved in LPS biosynthesis